MKAKKIYESLDFHRGADPKESMGLGIKARIEKLVETLYEELEWNSPDISIRPGWEIEYIGLPGGSMIREIKSIIEKSGLGEILKVRIGDPENSRAYDDGASSHTYIISPKAKFARILGESVQFQRGADPKSAMDIGLKQKYGKTYDVFTMCHHISKRSEDFEYVSDIIIEDYPYFVIESKYTHTDIEDGSRIQEQFVIKLFPNDLECYNPITNRTDMFFTVEGFNELTKAGYYKQNDGIFESTAFRRSGNPKGSMDIGLNALGLKIDGIYEKNDHGYNIRPDQMNKLSSEEGHEVLNNMSYPKYSNYLLHIEDPAGKPIGGQYYSIGYTRKSAFPYEYIIFEETPYKIRKES
jgi:hypothetical protein